MKRHTALLPVPPADDAGASPEHHRQPTPHDHLCTCGRLRDDCVRDSIRHLWAPTAPR